MKKVIFIILLFSSLSYSQAVRMFLYTADPSGGCQYPYFGQNTVTGKLFFCNNGSWSTSIINGSTTGTAGSIVLSNSPTIVTPSITTGFTIGGIALSGTILRGNGTNFVASTATYPNTTTINQVLYSTATNTIGGSPNLTFDGTTLGIANITGGSSVSQTFTFQTTTGNGTTDSFVFKCGNNGATTCGTLNSTGLQVGSSAAFSKLWLGGVTANANNFVLFSDGLDTYVNTQSNRSIYFLQNFGANFIDLSPAAGYFRPSVDNSANLGSDVSHRWANAYIVGLHSGASSMTLATGAGDVTAITIDASQNLTFAGKINGQPLYSGTAPTIAMGDCGSTPEGTFATGATNSAGTVNVGGGSVTSCKVTFGQSFTNTPTCTISDSSTTITGDISAISTSSFTSSFSLSLGGGKLYYHCT